MIDPAVCIVSKSCSLDYMSYDVHYILWPMFVNVHAQWSCRTSVTFRSSFLRYYSRLHYVLWSAGSCWPIAAAGDVPQLLKTNSRIQFTSRLSKVSLYKNCQRQSIVAHSIAFRVVSIYWQGDDPFPLKSCLQVTCPLLSVVSYGRCQNS